ncbi:MAG: sensor histidine kinase, partial [Actinobacteria bacterium]|nr:sensor histidine kinase [Actinomycetota bacterium]
GRPLAADVVASALEDSLSESDELGSLVEELVALSAVAGPTLDPGSHQEINVGELVGSVVTRANRRSGREISLTVADESATVFGNYSRLERAVTNIVNNAVKFAPMGRVDVSVLSTDAIDIIVEDAGPGIAPHDREHATDRFWRGASARSLPGSGLGLSIVADIAKEFKGVVTIGESQSLGGARIGLHLPATTA